MGASSPANFTWEWRTGDTLSKNWEYWRAGNPNRDNKACMRAYIAEGTPLSFVDTGCRAGIDFNCILCDA